MYSNWWSLPMLLIGWTRGLLKIEYQGVKTVTKFQTMVGFILYSFIILVKFEVLHDQPQLPDLSQSGSTKWSINKVTMSYDISVLIHICFVYTVSITNLNTASHKLSIERKIPMRINSHWNFSLYWQFVTCSI